MTGCPGGPLQREECRTGVSQDGGETRAREESARGGSDGLGESALSGSACDCSSSTYEFRILVLTYTSQSTAVPGPTTPTNALAAFWKHGSPRLPPGILGPPETPGPRLTKLWTKHVAGSTISFFLRQR